MEYKVLVQLFVPEIEQTYELYLPINKNIYQVKKMIEGIFREYSMDHYADANEFILMNRREATVYQNGDYVRNTNIRNGTELVLYKQMKSVQNM